MKVVIGALLFAAALIGIPIALVTVPASAVRDDDKRAPSATDFEPGWARCGIHSECLR